MSRYKTLIFDLDGTLLDTLGDLTDGVNHALSRFCFAERTRDEVRSFIGNGVPTLLRRALPADTDEKTHAEAVRLFGEFYRDNMLKHTRPYEGIASMLETLRDKGFGIGVVSNKRDSAVKALCAHFFGNTVRVALGAVSEETRKPSPVLLNAAMDALGADSGETVFIGDSEVDIAAAANAGIDIICVGWGYRDGSFLRSSGAKKVAADTDNLLKLLTTVEQGV